MEKADSGEEREGGGDKGEDDKPRGEKKVEKERKKPRRYLSRLQQIADCHLNVYHSSRSNKQLLGYFILFFCKLYFHLSSHHFTYMHRFSSWREQIKKEEEEFVASGG